MKPVLSVNSYEAALCMTWPGSPAALSPGHPRNFVAEQVPFNLITEYWEDTLLWCGH